MKSLINWSLSKFGLYTDKNRNILLLGLDNAGKTTLLELLSDDRISINIPTQNPISKEFIINNNTFRAYDLGGHKSIRKLWDDYLYNIDGLVFIIDAYERDRFYEVREEYCNLITKQDILKKPILILGNKIDITSSCSEEELNDLLGIDHLNQNIKIFMCSILNRYNIRNAFEWFANKIDN